MSEERDLIAQPLSRDELTELVRLAGGVEYLLSKKSPHYKAHRDEIKTDDEWLELMAQEPRLIKRPVVVDGTTVYIGFDAEKWDRLR